MLRFLAIVLILLTTALADLAFPASIEVQANGGGPGSDTTAIHSGSAAGGDLSGTYPNPSVASLAITDAKVAAANKDGLAAVASMRTLGTGATQAAAGNQAMTPLAHASTHLPGGSDALSVAAPTSVGNGNSIGTANTFSRSDHVHNAFEILSSVDLTDFSLPKTGTGGSVVSNAGPTVGDPIFTGNASFTGQAGDNSLVQKGVTFNQTLHSFRYGESGFIGSRELVFANNVTTITPTVATSFQDVALQLLSVGNLSQGTIIGVTFAGRITLASTDQFQLQFADSSGTAIGGFSVAAALGGTASGGNVTSGAFSGRVYIVCRSAISSTTTVQSGGILVAANSDGLSRAIGFDNGGATNTANFGSNGNLKFQVKFSAVGTNAINFTSFYWWTVTQ